MPIPNYKKLRVPTFESYVPLQESECVYIYKLIKKERIKNTLEIGMAYGFSTVYILAATQSKHFAIDPVQSTWYKNYGVKNVKSLGLSKYLNLIEGYDYSVLPDLLNSGKKFNLIFIDGDHKFDAIFLDFYYSDLMLEPGGFVILHDSWLRSTQLVASWIDRNRKEYKQVKSANKNLVIFKKLSSVDERSWHDFREFYTLKSVILYNFFKIFKIIPFLPRITVYREKDAIE